MRDAAPALLPDFDLTGHTTMGLRARATLAARVEDTAQIPLICALAEQQGQALHILGGGSNSLAREEVAGITALIATKGRRIEQTPQGVQVTAAAGEDWPALVEWVTRQGFGGLENLAGIPGTIGAAPVQNIGAYGIELADRFHSLTAWDREAGVWRQFGLADCAFAYRDSLFKAANGRFIIAEVTLALPADWAPLLTYAGLDAPPLPATPVAVMERVLALRGSKLPDWRRTGNAGSFFHNPVVAPEVAAKIPGTQGRVQADGRLKLSAAWLIEHCGLKGLRLGPVGVSDLHALVLVNHGGASLADLEQLSARIIETVWRDCGVRLQPEPLVLG